MPFNGSGTFNRSYSWVSDAANSIAPSATRFDADANDIATALSNCLTRDGQGKPSSDIDWNAKKITNLADPTISSGAATKNYVDTTALLLAGGTMTGPLVTTTVTVNGSTVPANGVYLPAANTVGIATNTTQRATINSAGEWNIVAATGANATVVINGTTGVNLLQLLSTSAAGRLSAGYNVGLAAGGTWNLYTVSTDKLLLGTTGAAAIDLWTNNTQRVVLGSAGNVTINAPSSANPPLTLTGPATAWVLTLNGGASTQSYARWQVSGSDSGFVGCAAGVVAGGSSSDFAIAAQGQLVLGSNVSRAAATIGTAGNVTINAPSSGTALTVTSTAAGTAQSWTDGTVSGVLTMGGGSFNFGGNTAVSTQILSNGTARLNVGASGNVTVNAPSSGVTLTVSGVSGTHSTKIADSATNSWDAGFLDMPVNAQTGTTYTTVIADRGKTITLNNATMTATIDDTLGYPVGTVIAFVNLNAANATVTCSTAANLKWEGTASTGARTVGQFARLTAHKVAANTWLASGAIS